MPDAASGGGVEHEIFMFNNLILFVIDIGFKKGSQDYFAQVLLELVCTTSHLFCHGELIY